MQQTDSIFPTFSSTGKAFARATSWTLRKATKPILIGAMALYTGIGISNKYQENYMLNKQLAVVSEIPQFDYLNYANRKNAMWHYQVGSSYVFPSKDGDIAQYYWAQSRKERAGAVKEVTEKELDVALSHLQPAIEELKRGAACKPEDYCPPRKRAEYAEIFPEFAGIRSLARVAAVDAGKKIEGGEVREGLEELLATVEMGNDVARDTILIGHLVGYAVQENALGPLKEALDAKTVNAVDTRYVARELERLDAEKVPLREVLKDEYSFARGSLINILGRHDFGFMEGGAPLWRAYVNIPGVKAMALNNFDRIFGGAINSSSKLYAEAIRGTGTDLEKEIPKYDLITKMVFPNLSPAITAEAKTRAILRGTALMYALEAYKTEKGEYPERLDALKPEYVSTITLDPFSGNPFVYSRTEGGYQLYSVGPNVKDDKGKPLHAAKIHSRGPGDIVFQKGKYPYVRSGFLDWNL